MKTIIQMALVTGSMLLVGCGGGGGSSAGGDTTPPKSSTKVYKNKNLPSIQKDIPESLIKKDNEKSFHKLQQKVGDKSTGFQLFQESMGYFYFKQMEMNINLSYMDSVWSQIETYCQEEESCFIPKDKIIFTYTQELYNHDIELIEIYETKSGDTQSFNSTKERLKTKIGETTKLGEATLVNLQNSSYDYELKVDISNVTFDNDKLITSTKWNRKDTIYQVREELIDGYNFDPGICRDRAGGLIYYGYDYNKSANNIDNLYTYGYDMKCESENDEGKVESAIQKYSHKIQLLELANSTKLKEHISYKIINEEYNPPLDYYLEGELTETGGYVIASDTEGYYNNEKFDVEGNIVSNVSCIGDMSNKLDDCTIQDKELIKSIVTENYYKVGWLYVEPSINVMAEHSAVFFNENNTLNAYINCSIFKADYHLDNSGITFSNIQEESNNSLVCLDNDFATSFKIFLKQGHEFNNDGYVVWNGLMADLDIVAKKSKFDKNAFMAKLTENRYVDSYTMNNLFKIHSLRLGGFSNPSENKSYFLSQEPTMKVENEKIYFDLIDATLEAEIQVINNDTIKFKNIIKTVKTNFVYPIRNCTNEPGPNECLGEDASLQYEDDKFTQVVENFLNGSVSVGNGGNSESGSLWFHNETLSFEGSYLK